MKHIGIDARLLFQTGVGTYLQNLLHYLPRNVDKSLRFTVYCRKEDEVAIHKMTPQVKTQVTTALWHSWAEQVDFLRQLQKDSLDLMHFTYFGHPIFYSGRFISTVHDVTPLLYKTGRASTKHTLTYALKHSVFSYVLKNQVERSVALITPTHTVKEQLIQRFGSRLKNKIVPIYEGVSFQFEHEKPSKRPISSPYYLYVGNFYPHKNVQFLIRAFAQSNSNRVLVLAGPNDFFLKRILSELNDDEKKLIILREKQSVNELATLYTHADALIHPSISEGFGLPLVEAMHFKTPIISSCIPVFRELMGEVKFGFDPYSEHSFISAITRFENQSDIKREEENPQFSFKVMAQKTVELYLAHA